MSLQHPEFSRDDVGPAGEQIQRQAGGHGGYLHAVLQRAGWDFEFAGGHAEQSRKGVLRHVAGSAQLKQILGQAVVLRPLAEQLGVGDQAVAAHRLVDGQDLLVFRARALLLLDLLVELKDLKVSG